MSLLGKANLWKFQKKASKNIVDTPRSLLMADMGLGKTIISLHAIQKVKNKGKLNGKVILLAPPKVAESVWTTEVDNWKHINLKVSSLVSTVPEVDRLKILDDDADVHVLSSGLIFWFADVIKEASYEPGYKWPYVWMIADESSQYRSIGSQRAKIAYKLSLLVQRVTLLTATPAPKDYVNLYQQFKLLDDGDRLGKTASQYKQRYFDIYHKNYIEVVKIRKGAKKKIHKKVKDVCFRFDAADYLKDLPQLDKNFIFVDLPQRAHDIEKELKKEGMITINGQVVFIENEGVLAGKRHQIANGIVLDENGEQIFIHDAKLTRLVEVLDELGDRNVLIAYSHTADRQAILKKLKSAQSVINIEDPEPEVVSSAVWFKGQSKLITRWNENKNSGLRYVCHPASMGHGLNLQKGGSQGIWYGLPRDFELYEQFRGRVHRQGQKDRCAIHHLIARHTIDHDILDSTNWRDKNQQGFMSAMK